MESIKNAQWSEKSFLAFNEQNNDLSATDKTKSKI